jgi:hypothetical protein
MRIKGVTDIVKCLDQYITYKHLLVNCYQYYSIFLFWRAEMGFTDYGIP